MQKIYLAGHRGMVGSAILRQLNARGETNIVTRAHAELDLTDQGCVRDFLQAETALLAGRLWRPTIRAWS